MIIALLSQWRGIPGLAGNETLAKAFTWLEREAATASEGIHNLGAEGFYANVMLRTLKARDAAILETHHHTLDIHFTIEGTEGIEYSLLSDLSENAPYNVANEAQYFAHPEKSQCTVRNAPGMFALIFPEEPHMTGLASPECDKVRKVCVKIPAELLG